MKQEVVDWLARTRAKFSDSGVTTEDLDALERIVHRKGKVVRQRLLYLHAATPSVRSSVIAMALHEPVRGSITEITVQNENWPYKTVFDAILDGWQAIHFPLQTASFDDREIDILGYEFVLQKLEAYDE